MLPIILVSLFVAALIAAGIWGMKKTTTLNDFFLGSRSIGPWVSAFSYGASYFSAVVFIGFAGKFGWGFGLNSLWIAFGNAFLGAFLAWIVLGRRTRTMTQNLDVVTMPEFLQERYGGRYFKMIAAVVIFLFLLPYAASVFKGLGYLFEVNFNVSFDTALLIMVAIVAVYLILGGYFAMTMTDFIQGFIMLTGAVVMALILTGKAGGFIYSIQQISANFYENVQSHSSPNYLLLASIIFMTSFGAWGMPQMVQKFYSIKNEKVIKIAAFTTLGFCLIISVCAYFTGALTHMFFDSPVTVNGIVNYDAMVPDMLIKYLPQGIMAIILLLILSASMSTLSALVLVSASSIAIDLYKGHINPDISKRNSVFMMRFLSGLFILISYMIARYQFSFIVTLMSLSWGVVAGGFLAPYVYGLYWKRTTLIGAKAGMVGGIATAIILFYVMGPEKSPIASSIAIITPFIIVPAVSLMTKKPSSRRIVKAFKGI
ncbi:MAG: sodium:solute symporter [Endomicrobium sp.]|jgi:SSS family solute:Na+ symporter|nr:sodium:solute symporter [Endomicrobium sp.]